MLHSGLFKELTLAVTPCIVLTLESADYSLVSL